MKIRLRWAEHGEKVNNKRQQQFGNYRQQIGGSWKVNRTTNAMTDKSNVIDQRHHLAEHQPRNAVLAVKADGRVNLFDWVVHEFTLFVEILIRFYPVNSVNFAQARRRYVEA